MWGQVDHALRSYRAWGIIPTRVGTSVNQVSAYDSNEDHPHACGDKAKSTIGACCIHEDHPHACGDKAILGVNLTALIGSSPRVWGQGRVNIQICTDIRIIPTRVGTRHVYADMVRR